MAFVDVDTKLQSLIDAINRAHLSIKEKMIDFEAVAFNCFDILVNRGEVRNVFMHYYQSEITPMLDTVTIDFRTEEKRHYYVCCITIDQQLKLVEGCE